MAKKSNSADTPEAAAIKSDPCTDELREDQGPSRTREAKTEGAQGRADDRADSACQACADEPGAKHPDLPELCDEEILYDLADLFKVFADTTRIKILYALMEEDMCVACIADVVGVSQSAVSHQLRSLKQAHLVKFRRDGKQVVYSLSDDHVYTMLSQGITHVCE